MRERALGAGARAGPAAAESRRPPSLNLKLEAGCPARADLATNFSNRPDGSEVCGRTSRAPPAGIEPGNQRVAPVAGCRCAESDSASSHQINVLLHELEDELAFCQVLNP